MSATVTITSRPRGRVRRLVNRLWAAWLRYRVEQAEQDIVSLQREADPRLERAITGHRKQCQAWRAEITVLEQF